MWKENEFSLICQGYVLCRVCLAFITRKDVQFVLSCGEIRNRKGTIDFKFHTKSSCPKKIVNSNCEIFKYLQKLSVASGSNSPDQGSGQTSHRPGGAKNP